MRLTNLTRRNEIGANSYLLETADGTRLVLDSGMDPKEEGLASIPDFGHLPEKSVDAIVISHSHLDHVGSLPVLMAEQTEAQVYMTEPTAALADAMLHNSVNVMSSKRDELGIQEYPFFTHRELDHVTESWNTRGYDKAFPLGKKEGKTMITFYDAGHILGSCGVMIEDGKDRIFYTGDVNFEDQTLTVGAYFPEENIDTLIIETTRGAVPRDPKYTREAEEAKLGAAIAETLKRGGSVLIPVFAMGKTQEACVMIDNFKADGIIPEKTPLFIGGLSTKMTGIFDRFADKVRRNYPGLKILEDIDIQMNKRSRNRRTRKELRYSPGCIYALSSGMMSEKTVSNGFAFQFLDNPKNALLFVGYAAPDSPAGKIREAKNGDMVELDPEKPKIQLNCQVEVYDFSGHAPRDHLLDYIIDVKPKKCVLVHGDPDALGWFQQQIQEHLPDTKVIVPVPNEETEI